MCYLVLFHVYTSIITSAYNTFRYPGPYNIVNNLTIIYIVIQLKLLTSNTTLEIYDTKLFCVCKARLEHLEFIKAIRPTKLLLFEILKQSGIRHI